MQNGFVSYLAWWGPYAIGLLAIFFGIMLKLTKSGDTAAVSQSTADPNLGRGGVALPLALVAALLLLGLILTGIYARPSDTSWSFGTVLLIGGLSALAVQLLSHWKPLSSFHASSAIYLGAGLALLESAFLRNHFQDAPVVYLFVAALGAWFATSVLYYGNPTSKWLAARAFALTSIVIAAAVAMGAYRYTKSGAGSLFPIDACAIVLLVGIICSMIAALRRGGVYKQIGSALLLLLGTWWLGGLMAGIVLDQPEAGLSVLAGAATALFVYLVSASSGEKPGLIGNSEAGVLAVLLAVACAALSMRWLGGYGVSLAAVGALSVLPFVQVLTNSAACTEPDAEIAASGAGVVAALAGLALVRAFTEGTVGAGASVRLFESYVTTGLVLGGALALMQASLSGGGVRSALAGVGRGFATVVLGLAVVLAAAYFWRGEAVSGMMLGTAIGLFLLIAAGPFFGKQAATPDLALGVPLFTTVLVPAFLTATLNLTRDHKVLVMVWTLAAVALIAMVASVLRLRKVRQPV